MSQIKSMCQKIEKKSFGWLQKMGKIMKNKGEKQKNDDENGNKGVEPKADRTKALSSNHSLHGPTFVSIYNDKYI